MFRLVWLAPLVLSACFELPPQNHGPAGVTRDEPSAAPLPASLTHPGTRRATALLTALPVRPQEPHTGYARDQFGPPWADADRNGCDTRNDILRRDLEDPRFEPTSRRCALLSGVLADPYTGTQIHFDRGGGAQVDIDHVVALSNAWATGAAHWPYKKRIALANDPLNLLAAQAAANRAKSDADAATWLPPDRAYHCTYVARQIAVKTKYELWVSQAEHDAMATVLRACPDELAPTGDAPTLAPIDPPEPPSHAAKQSPPHATAPAKAPPAATPSTPAKSAQDPSYGSCKQARAHHAGPYVRGKDPEYAYYQDRDGDGIVCE